MLVMRYFGYLGLCSVMDHDYKLHKERLVDYASDRQVIRNNSLQFESTIQGERDYDYVQELACFPLKLLNQIFI